MTTYKRKKAIAPDGSELKLYYVRDLARAVNREPITIRFWIKNGIMPDTCFRDEKDRRLYSLDMIEIIARAMKQCNVKKGCKLEATPFRNIVTKQLEDLYEEYKERFTGGEIL